MSCLKLKWKLPSWLRLRNRSERHNLPEPVRVVPHPPPPSPTPEQQQQQQRESKGPGFYRQVFCGKMLKLEAWEELNTDLPYGAVAYHRTDLSTFEDEMFCRLNVYKQTWDRKKKLEEKKWKKSGLRSFRTPEELEMMLKKKELKQLCRDLKLLGKHNPKLALEFCSELKEYLDAVSECDNHRLVRTWEETAPEDMDPLQGTSDSYLHKEFRKAPVWNPKLCEPWAEPSEPLTPEAAERLQKAQRNRFHSELSPNDREMWKLSKWHYDRRPEHEQAHYLPNHELPSRPGQFELEDLQRAFVPPLPGTPDYSDEMASTDSEEVREAIAAEHRESRRAGKREFSLPVHLKNFDPFAEDNRPKIPTVVASAPVTVQKPFPEEIQDCKPESVEESDVAVAEEPEVEGDADDEAETSFVDSELDLVIDVDDLLEIALAHISAKEDDQNEGNPEVPPEDKSEDEIVKEAAIPPPKSPVQTVKLVMVEVEPPPKPPTPTNVVIVQAEVHREPEQGEVPPPLPEKKKNQHRRRLVQFQEDLDKIEVDKSFIEPVKPKEHEDGQAAKVPRYLRNIQWSFFKPLQHPKNPPGMSKRKIVEQDLGEI